MLSGSESPYHPDQAKFRGTAFSYKSLQGNVLSCCGTHQDLPAMLLRLIREGESPHLAWSIAWCHRSSR